MENTTEILKSVIMCMMPLAGLLNLISGVLRYHRGGEGKALGLVLIFMGLALMILPFLLHFSFC